MLVEIAWYAARGTFELVHCTLCSAYGDPIDNSPWSLTFCALSVSKEIALIIMALMGAVMFLKDIDYLQPHAMLLVILIILIVENKTVSLDVLDLRKNYCDHVAKVHVRVHYSSVLQ